MKEAWIAEVVYPSGNVVSLGSAPSEAAGKARCAKHAVHALQLIPLPRPLVWKMEEVDRWFTRNGSNTYRVSKK